MNEKEIQRRVMWLLVDKLGGTVSLDMDEVSDMDMLDNSLSVDMETRANHITLKE